MPLRFCTLAALCTLTLLAATACAGEPAIRNLNVRGLQAGGATTIVLEGDDLGAAPRLLLPFAAQQELQPGSTEKQATFRVTLAEDVVPGYYQLWVATEQGVSLPVVIALDRLPQRRLEAAVDALPVALHGAVAGSTVVETTFDGRAGQVVRVEVEAQRLGSKLRPVVHLYDARRKHLAWAWGNPSLGGDARLEATLPADGAYVVTLHDLEYAAPSPGYFRLRIGQWLQADQVFPPRVAVGQSTTVELLGPAAEPTAVPLPAMPFPAAVPLPWPGQGLWSGPRAVVEVSPEAHFVEQAAAEVQELPAAPRLAISGRLKTPREEDRYRLAVRPGSKLRIDLFAERLFSPVDAAVVIRNDQGDQLARAEDSPETLDPQIEYAVPDSLTHVVVGVADAQGRGGPKAIYCLTIDAREPGEHAADVDLLTPAARIAVPTGGRAVVPVWAARRGDEGPLEIVAQNLPAGLRLTNATIAAGCDGTLLEVARGDGAEGAAIVAWRSRSASGVERSVRVQDHLLERLQPWLASEVAIAATITPSGDFTIEWRDLPDDAGLAPAGKLALPVKLTRPADPAFEKSTVRLTLLTSQLPPRQNRQPDTNKMLRLEKAIELAANQSDGEATLLLPADLPSLSYDLCLQADLLSVDKKPLRTAYTPVRRLPVRNSLVVQLTSPARVEVPLDAKTGAMLKVEGKIERREGLTGDVTLSVAGLPAGVRADNVTVKADAVDFALTIAIPANARPGPWPPLQITASGVPDSKQANVRVKSREVLLQVVLQPPPQP